MGTSQKLITEKEITDRYRSMAASLYSLCGLIYMFTAATSGGWRIPLKEPGCAAKSASQKDRPEDSQQAAPAKLLEMNFGA